MTGIFLCVNHKTLEGSSFWLEWNQASQSTCYWLTPTDAWEQRIACLKTSHIWLTIIGPIFCPSYHRNRRCCFKHQFWKHRSWKNKVDCWWSFQVGLQKKLKHGFVIKIYRKSISALYLRVWINELIAIPCRSQVVAGITKFSNGFRSASNLAISLHKK